MKKLRSWFAGRKAKMITAAMMVASILCVAAGAVDESASSSITTAIVGSAQTMVSDCIAMMAALLPVVLPLLAIGIVVAYGVRYIKSIGKKA